MSTMASQITGVSIVHSTVCSSADQRIHQSSAWLAFVRGIHRWPVNSPHKGQQRGECFHFMTSSWEKTHQICHPLYCITELPLIHAATDLFYACELMNRCICISFVSITLQSKTFLRFCNPVYILTSQYRLMNYQDFISFHLPPPFTSQSIVFWLYSIVGVGVTGPPLSINFRPLPA